MTIYIDYYLKQGNMSRIMHTKFTEEDLMQLLHQKFIDGELPCPISYDKEKVKVDFVIDKVEI